MTRKTKRPLSDCHHIEIAGWGARTRTWEWRNQKSPGRFNFVTHFSQLRRKAHVLHQRVTGKLPTLKLRALTEPLKLGIDHDVAVATAGAMAARSLYNTTAGVARIFAPAKGGAVMSTISDCPDDEVVLDYATLDAMRGDDDGDGPLDHPCPLCGPDRSTDYNRMRPTLRTWKPNPGFITFFCARCEAKGSAQFDAAQMLFSPLPKMPPPRKPARSADLYFVERLWREATPTLPPRATAYFRWRGIPLEDVPPGVLRFHPKCPWEGSKMHCLLARYSDAVTGEPRGLWRRVVVSGLRRSDPNPKPMTLGPMGGCVIRLFPDVRKRLVIAEGIETALTAATRFTHRGKLLRPAWATGCAGNMKRLPVIEGVEQLIIIADNDESGTGQAAAEECAQRWSDAGREVVCLMPEQLGFDLNDLVKP
jgi:Toprim domain